MVGNLKPRRRFVPNSCAKCASHEVAVVHFSDIIEFKGLTLEVDGLAETVCQRCGFAWATEGQEKDNLNVLRSAFGRERDAIREAEGLLTGDQIAGLLEELKISKADAARYFGGGPNAFSKYINGDVLQSFAMDRLLRMTRFFRAPAVRFLADGAATVSFSAIGTCAPVVRISTSKPIVEAVFVDPVGSKVGSV